MYRTLGIFVLLFVGVTTLKADPVVINGGTLFLDRSDQATRNPFTLTGDGTVINGTTSGIGQVLGSFVVVVSGRQTVPLRISLDSQDGTVGATFPISVGGITYNSGHLILLQLRFTELSFIVPGPASGFTVTAPFTMNGFVAGYNGIGFTDEIFSNSLAGQGTQVFTFTHCAPCNDPLLGTLYILDSWTATFGAVATGVTIQTVPEPGSIFLLLTSVSALSWMKRRNRRNG
jgi:hypothetical protein